MWNLVLSLEQHTFCISFGIIYKFFSKCSTFHLWERPRVPCGSNFKHLQAFLRLSVILGFKDSWFLKVSAEPSEPGQDKRVWNPWSERSLGPECQKPKYHIIPKNRKYNVLSMNILGVECGIWLYCWKPFCTFLYLLQFF